MFHFRMSASSPQGSPTATSLRLHKTTHDSVFRKVFKEKDCLMSFLNSIYYPDSNDITDIEYCSEVTPGVNVRSTTIDIHCKTQNGSHVFVEVQLCAMPTDALFKRFQLYSAQILVEMWKNLPTIRSAYRRYSDIQPLHCLVIVDFPNAEFENGFQSDSGVHKFQMFHVPSNQPMSNLHFLQDYTYIYLPKIRQLSLDNSLRSEWFAFLTTDDGAAVDIDGVVDGNVKHAYLVASGIHDAAIENDRRFEADLITIREDGVLQERLQCAKRMRLQNIPVETISEVTRLSGDEINNIEL